MFEQIVMVENDIKHYLYYDYSIKRSCYYLNFYLFLKDQQEFSLKVLQVFSYFLNYLYPLETNNKSFKKIEN